MRTQLFGRAWNVQVPILWKAGDLLKADPDRPPIDLLLGPYVRVSSKTTPRRLLAYLGASPEQLAKVDQSIRSWCQGTATITLQPGRDTADASARRACSSKLSDEE